MPMKRNALAAGAAALASICTGMGATWAVTAGFNSFTTDSWRRSEVRASPRPIPDVKMQNHQGQETSFGQLCSKVLVVDFIYTRCNAVCRSQGAMAAQLARRLSEHAKDVQVLSISFDPQNDTPASLSKFKRAMETAPTAWQLTRPTHNDGKQALLQTFGVVVIPDGYGGYDHNSALHVVSQCKLVQILDTEDIEGAVKTVRTLVAEQKG